MLYIWLNVFCSSFFLLCWMLAYNGYNNDSIGLWEIATRLIIFGVIKQIIDLMILMFHFHFANWNNCCFMIFSKKISLLKTRSDLPKSLIKTIYCSLQYNFSPLIINISPFIRLHDVSSISICWARQNRSATYSLLFFSFNAFSSIISKTLSLFVALIEILYT